LYRAVSLCQRAGYTHRGVRFGEHNSTTGQMTRTRYYQGSTDYNAYYHYDSVTGRLTKLTDWIDGTDGLRYEHDALGRLTKLINYDDDELTYSYDAGGRVTTVNDYLGNNRNYYYDAANRLTLLTAPDVIDLSIAPANKNWQYTHNDNGLPTMIKTPTGYEHLAYDDRNRLTKKSLETASSAGDVLAKFEWEYDDAGNIVSIEEADGYEWSYDYDDRYRLTAATYANDSGNIEANYTYSYDAADNLLTKVTPFFDDFADGSYSNWTVLSGSFDASNGYLVNDLSSTQNSTVQTAQTNGDVESWFSMYREGVSGTSGGALIFMPRRSSSGDELIVRIGPSDIRVRERVSGVWTTLDTYSTGVSNNKWYEFRVRCDGTQVDVWMRERDSGDEFELILSATASVTTSANMRFVSFSNRVHRVDNIRIHNGSKSNTHTYTYNAGNELTAMTGPNGTETYTYDDWGRQVSKSRGSYSASYEYRYGGMLYEVVTDYPGSFDVRFEYRGDRKRHSSGTPGVPSQRVQFDWDAGWNMMGWAMEHDGTVINQVIANPYSPVNAPAYDKRGGVHFADQIGSTRALMTEPGQLARTQGAGDSPSSRSQAPGVGTQLSAKLRFAAPTHQAAAPACRSRASLGLGLPSWSLVTRG